MLRTVLNSWVTKWLYKPYSTPRYASCYKLNTSSQTFMPRFEPGTSQVAVRIFYRCVNTRDVFTWRRFELNELFKFDGNCFFLSACGPPLVSIIFFMTPCFGVHEFKSLSPSCLALMFSYFTSSHYRQIMEYYFNLGYEYFLPHYLNFTDFPMASSVCSWTVSSVTEIVPSLIEKWLSTTVGMFLSGQCENSKMRSISCMSNINSAWTGLRWNTCLHIQSLLYK